MQLIQVKLSKIYQTNFNRFCQNSIVKIAVYLVELIAMPD